MMPTFYHWLETALQENFELVRKIKESPRGSVSQLRHRTTGQKVILRRFTGNAEVYQKLLGYSCQNLPKILEVATQEEENLVLEEFIEGDTLGFLLQDALFSVEETRQIVTQICPRTLGAARYGCGPSGYQTGKCHFARCRRHSH